MTSTPIEAGTILSGRYEVEAEIGSGGYGKIYRARQMATGQRVAIKILDLEDTPDPAFSIRRFFLEARATSSLQHPNTVRVFDFGQDDSGVVFFVMELISGCTLHSELRRREREDRPFSEEEAVAIGVAVTKSLFEAHLAGVIHRDLKPDNIFLSRSQDETIVKVLDFGIAKLGSSRHTLSSSDEIHGTPAYMSPEHATAQPVDARSDLYSLGVVLYELRTFQRPFDGDSDVQILYQHVHAPPPSPVELSKTPMSDAFRALLERALAKRPEDRFRDAREMREALERCTSNAGRRLARRRVDSSRVHRWRTAAVVLALVLVAGVGLAVRSSVRSPVGSSVRASVGSSVGSSVSTDRVSATRSLTTIEEVMTSSAEDAGVASPTTEPLAAGDSASEEPIAAPRTDEASPHSPRAEAVRSKEGRRSHGEGRGRRGPRPPSREAEGRADVLDVRLEDLLREGAE